jgi:enoyl-CoA hydratase/carnithine racemase
MPVTLTVAPDGVAHLTLDRAAKRNALDNAMVASLREQVAVIAGRDDVRVVVVRGAGGTFCAGADIADWVAPSNAVAAEQSRAGAEAFDALALLPVPSVAVVEGTAVGGGFELALACDLRVAADDAVLGLPELGLGNLPSWGGTARLADVAGIGVARHLLLSGELVSGARAAELLVVTSAHPAAELDAALDALVARLLGSEPHAVSLAKGLFRALEHRPLLQEDGLAAYTAGLDSSRQRKQAFLDRKAAAKAARSAETAAHV